MQAASEKDFLRQVMGRFATGVAVVLVLVELQLEERGVSAGEYAAHIWRTLSETINEHLRQDGLPAVARLGEGGLLSPGEPQCVETVERFLANAPVVSVIVATRSSICPLLRLGQE